QEQLLDTFKQGNLTAMVGLNDAPSEITRDKNTTADNFSLAAAKMVFFKTNEGVLADAHVRQALVAGADRQSIIKSRGYPAKPVTEPLLSGQLGYDRQFAQTYNVAAAKQALDSGGWTLGQNGMRAKAGQQLQFTL